MYLRCNRAEVYGMKALKFSMKSHAVMLVALQTEVQEPPHMNPEKFSSKRHEPQELVLIYNFRIQI